MGRTAAQGHLRGSGQWKPTELDGVSERTCMLLHFTGVWLFATKWTVACKAPLSMGFSRQEYWSGLPCPPLGDLPDPGVESGYLNLLHWQACSLPPVLPGKPSISGILLWRPIGLIHLEAITLFSVLVLCKVKTSLHILNYHYLMRAME